MVRLDIGDVDRFMGRFSIGRDSTPLNTTDSLHFLRIKVPGGFLDSEQMSRLAELTETYSRSRAEITNRQDIQLHWVEAKDTLDIFSVMDELGFSTDMCGQGFNGARYGDPRNIVCCPVSGVAKGEILNGAPLLKKLSDFFIGNPKFQDMPRKFKFSISGCGSDCTRAVINDLSLVSVEKEGEVGFTLLLGGGIGSSLPGPRLAKPAGVFVEEEDAFDIAVAAIEIHRDYGNRESKAKARFKWLLSCWGLEKFLRTLDEKTGGRIEEYDGPIFVRRGGHEGVQPQGEEGTHYVNIPLMGGTISSNEMTLLADLANEYGSGDLRLTPTQNIVIPNITRTKQLLKRLEEAGFSMTGPRIRWESMGCASDFCGKTKPPHAKAITEEIIDHLDNRLNKERLNDADFRIHVSGCPNNCCANLIAEVGLAGRLIREEGKIRQHYSLLLGGGFGTNWSLGRLIEENIPADEVKSKVENLLSNYFSKRRTPEGLRDFCNRSTIDELRSYLNSVD